MTILDADSIRQNTSSAAQNRISSMRVFDEIDSTNTYLMHESAPAVGMMSVAVTNNQTAGRGRHGKTWQSPPGAGLCLSTSYTFASRPENLSALTLVIGLAATAVLEELGVDKVQLKWPNDLVANNGKLAGILAEVKEQSDTATTVVTGIGVNVDMPDELYGKAENEWTRHVVDLKSLCSLVPLHEQIAGALMTKFCNTFNQFETDGFGQFADKWAGRDWLLGREITVQTADRQVSGIGAGIAGDGALLLDTPDSGTRRITSGSVVLAGSREQVL